MVEEEQGRNRWPLTAGMCRRVGDCECGCGDWDWDWDWGLICVMSSGSMACVYCIVSLQPQVLQRRGQTLLGALYCIIIIIIIHHPVWHNTVK
ncbi:hypothetical protein BCV70DRAFT_64341 [Testicularia cyperi]|uniref:Uncharacterized protein n=1 Tax=Testicularia cyperi TaxID=1882483 RepID=A0A317XX75_9BASI|nr:hypothetical protein BCV70DRAFT_64341 [Testicularia cyperi]